jgi:hypothetical protein
LGRASSVAGEGHEHVVATPLAGTAEEACREISASQIAVESGDHVLGAIPGIDVHPCPPHTNMFHMHLQGDERRLLDAALDVAQETGVWMFAKVTPTESPLRQKVELACGDATLELGDDEIVRLFEAVMARAR